MNKPKCVQITSAHTAFDTRIFCKECRTLAEAGYDVVLVAPEGEPGESGGVRISIVPGGKGRLRRMTIVQWRLLREALRQKARLYHFHDPELILAGLALKLLRKQVVYDVHEDLPRQLLYKTWLPWGLRHILSLVVEAGESCAVRLFDGVVAATPTIGQRFSPRKTVVVCNYPRFDEFPSVAEIPYSQRPPLAVYVGNLSLNRGIREMLAAMSLLPKDGGIMLKTAGIWDPPELEAEAPAMTGYERMEYLGCLPRRQIADLLGGSRLGLVVLHPIKNYLASLPVKLFEYMIAGLPVIASDFPLWREIIESAGCGLLVNPRNPREIADAVQWIMANPIEAAEMGRRGRQAIRERFNWNIESQKLFSLYDRILNEPNATVNDAGNDVA